MKPWGKGIRIGIAIKIFLPFFLLIVLVVSLIGYYSCLWFQLQQERILEGRLISIALTVADMVDPTIIVHIKPGFESSRTYRNILNLITKINVNNEARAIYIFDKKHRTIVDTTKLPIGTELFRLRLDSVELTDVFAGTPRCSLMYRGEEGRLYKTGYAPIDDKTGEVVAAVRVDASVDYLKAIDKIKKRFLFTGLIGILISGVLSFLLSRSILTPVRRLHTAARKLGQGDLSVRVKVKSNDELGFLARTFNEMVSDLKTRDENLKALSAGVAHEVRNSLAGLEINANIIMDLTNSGLSASRTRQAGEGKKKIDTTLIDAARNIHQELTHLKDFVNSFQDFSRPLMLERTPTDMESYLKEIVSSFSSLPQGKGLKTEIETIGEPVIVDIDPSRFRDVFFNLFLNASEAQGGGGSLKIILTNSQKAGIITISDSGSGITPEDLPKIWEPFFTKKARGTGLGLPIVKGIVEAHQGRIEGFSSRDGTTFRIEIPLAMNL